MLHYLSESDYRVVYNLSELEVSNAIIGQAFGAPGTTISRVVESSWIAPFFWRSIYFAGESLFKNTEKNLKGWFVDLGSPHCIQKRHLKFKHPTQLFIFSCFKAGNTVVWRQTDGSMDSTAFVNKLKEAFHFDPDHRRRSNVTILQDNAPCPISRKVGFNYLKTSKYATVLACRSFRYRHAPPTWTKSIFFWFVKT